jgi:hypothetical protein
VEEDESPRLVAIKSSSLFMPFTRNVGCGATDADRQCRSDAPQAVRIHLTADGFMKTLNIPVCSCINAPNCSTAPSGWFATVMLQRSLDLRQGGMWAGKDRGGEIINAND